MKLCIKRKFDKLYEALLPPPFNILSHAPCSLLIFASRSFSAIRPLPVGGGLLSFVRLVVLVFLVVLLRLGKQFLWWLIIIDLWLNHHYLVNWLHRRGHNFCLQKSRMPLAGLVYFSFLFTPCSLLIFPFAPWWVPLLLAPFYDFHLLPVPCSRRPFSCSLLPASFFNFVLLAPILPRIWNC